MPVLQVSAYAALKAGMCCKQLQSAHQEGFEFLAVDSTQSSNAAPDLFAVQCSESDCMCA